MLSLLLHTGGRPFAYDDIEVLQNMALAGTRLFAGLPNCVVSGCQLTPSGSNYDVGSGVLWLDGELRDFPGRAGVTLPALFQVGSEVKSDNRVNTLNGLNQACLREQNAALVDYDPGNPPSRRPLLLTANGPLMWWHRMQEKTTAMGKIEWVASYSATDYDSNGIGIGAAWGWAMCDGHGGRVNLGGRVAIGLDTSRTDYNSVGNYGGEEKHRLTPSEMPSHNHVDGNANKILKIATSNVNGGNTPLGFDNGPGELDIRYPGEMQPAGGGGEHENRPPYAVLLARQWVGFD